jgi:hypothetical protein
LPAITNTTAVTLQVSRLVSLFGLPTATAAVIAEHAFCAEAPR